MYMHTWYKCVAYVCLLYADACAYVGISACMQSAEEDTMNLLYDFVNYSFRSYHTDAGNQALVLWKSSEYPLKDESSL